MDRQTIPWPETQRSTPCLSELTGLFLHFGYLVPTAFDVTACPWYVRNGTSVRAACSPNEEELVGQGSAILRRIFENVERAHHVVPLSGGFDLRAVLASLLHAGQKNDITAVTFGVRGSLDYELGRAVAEALGVKHVEFNLDEIEVTTQALVDMVLREDLNFWVFDCYYNRLIPTMFGTGARYWSGFMGDVLSGSHLAPTESRQWQTAVDRFLEHARFARQVRLAHPDAQLNAWVPPEPLLPREWLTCDEQIDFAVRQERYTRRVVTARGYDYRTPFRHREWVTFMLSVPMHLRRGQRLYSRILQHTFPEAFSLPTKRAYGLALGDSPWRIRLRRYARGLWSRLAPHVSFLSARTNPMGNYLNFGMVIRRRRDFRTLIRESLGDLRKRALLGWLDLDHLMNGHLKGQRDYSRELTLLVSLEILLKAREHPRR